MASRMDKYYKNELVSNGRSTRNKSLYEKIRDMDDYSNIEGVATIENNNKIDIQRVKKLIGQTELLEEDKKRKQVIEKNNNIIDEEPINYDINDILAKVRKNASSSDSYRSLDEEQYKDLKNVSLASKKFDIEKEEKELKELINTLAMTKAIKVDDTNDVGLLDELKSDTMVGDADSIKKIIEDEKVNTKNSNDDKDEIDKSFYTSSFGFTSSDFEELKNINHNIKKSNKFIIILLISLIIIVIVFLVFMLIR